MKATRDEVEVILVNLILDGIVSGSIDQVKGFLQLSSAYVSLCMRTPSQRVNTHTHTHTQLSSLLRLLCCCTGLVWLSYLPSQVVLLMSPNVLWYCQVQGNHQDVLWGGAMVQCLGALVHCNAGHAEPCGHGR